MAEKNGDGIVYHCSDCSPGYVRAYGAGGDWPGSICGTWGLSEAALQYIHDHPEINHRFEDMVAFTLEKEVGPAIEDWGDDLIGDIGGVLAPIFTDPISVIEPILDPIVDIGEKIGEGVQQGYEIVKDGVVEGAIEAYHWIDENGCKLAVTGLIGAAITAAFAPAQPEGLAASTSLSVMAKAIDTAEKAVVVKAMTEVIADVFLLIPEVSDSVDHTLLKNIISNCLAKSLEEPELWGTAAGVFAAIAAAFAPVIADLICKKTCPEGFTKAFGA